MTNIVDELARIEKKSSPSKLGEQLSNAIITKVVTLIVIMMIVLPFIHYNPTNNMVEYASDTFQAINQQIGCRQRQNGYGQ